MRTIAFALLPLCFMTACGSRLPLSSQRGQGTDDAVAAQSGSGDRCQYQAIDAALQGSGFKNLDINKLFVRTNDGAPKSLCDLQRDSENQVMIVQFSGVTCGSCQEEGVLFTEHLGLTAKFGNHIGHAVVLTDFREDYTEEDFANFMLQHAPRSLRFHDEAIQLWRYFSVDPEAPERPTIVVYDGYGRAFVINQDRGGTAAHVEIAIEAAHRLRAAKINDPKSADATPNRDPNTNPKDPLIPSEDPLQPINGPVKPLPFPEPRPSIQPSPTPSTVPTPVPSPTLSPGKEPVQLTGSRNVALTGGLPDETLSSYFGSNDYLVIDISQVNCSPCIRMAQEQNASQSFQQKMSQGKCRNLTVVGNRELEAWLRKFPSSTFVGQRSRGVSSITSFASAWGFNSLATPTVFVIDRTGKRVASAVGSEPREVEQLCAK